MRLGKNRLNVDVIYFMDIFSSIGTKLSKGYGPLFLKTISKVRRFEKFFCLICYWYRGIRGKRILNE